MGGLGNAEQLVPPDVDLVDVVDVEVAVGGRKGLQELRPVLPDGEVDVPLADRNDLDEPLRALAQGGVEEERVDLVLAERRDRLLACLVLDIRRGEVCMVEVVLAVAVLPLRDGGIADAELGPVGDPRRHHRHFAVRRRVEGEVHASERLGWEIVVLDEVGRPEGGADDLGIGRAHSVGAERQARRLDSGALEDLRHDLAAEGAVLLGPDVEAVVAHAVGKGRRAIGADPANQKRG